MKLKEVQRLNRLEPLEGHYYQIPESVYHCIPSEYKKPYKFTFKRLVGVCISLWIFAGTIKNLGLSDIAMENKFAAIPLFVMALLIFTLSVSPRLHIEKYSKIIEARVEKVEEETLYFMGRRSKIHIATLYVPSMDKTINTCLRVGKDLNRNVIIPKYVVIVRNKNYHFIANMDDDYDPVNIAK